MFASIFFFFLHFFVLPNPDPNPIRRAFFIHALGPVRWRRCGWDAARLLRAVPILLDMQVPLPGQVVRLVVVRKAGFDVVAPSDDHALGSLLHWSDKLMLLHPWPVAAHHVHGFIHCQRI